MKIMFDLEKLKDNNAIFWVFHFPAIRETAASLGWAIGIHGSVTHDLDLMAMPWIDNHSTADELAAELAAVVANEEPWYEKSKRGEKPNGRIVYTIMAGGTYIDLNVIEP